MPDATLRPHTVAINTTAPCKGPGEEMDGQTATAALETTALSKLNGLGFRPARETDTDKMVCLLGVARVSYAKLVSVLGPPHSRTPVEENRTDGKEHGSWKLWSETMGEPVTVYSGDGAVRPDGTTDWHIGGLMDHDHRDIDVHGAPGVLAKYLEREVGAKCWSFHAYVMMGLHR